MCRSRKLRDVKLIENWPLVVVVNTYEYLPLGSQFKSL